MRNLYIVLVVAVLAIFSFGCIKTGEASGAASVDNSALPSDVPPPGATDVAPDPEVANLRAQLARARAERAQQQTSAPAQPDADVGQQAAPPAPQPPPLRGIPIPGIAGGPPVGMGVVLDGNIQMLTYRPAITQATYYVWLRNRTRPNRYLAVELVNGDDVLVPCGGRMGSWRPVIDMRTRQPVWILPPNSDACLTRPLFNCPNSDDGVCGMRVRVVQYSFSAPYAVKGYGKEHELNFSPGSPALEIVEG